MMSMRRIFQKRFIFSSLTRTRYCQKSFFWGLTLLMTVLFPMDFLLAQSFANDRSDIVRMLNDAGRALSARNAPRFLSYFDKKNIFPFSDWRVYVNSRPKRIISHINHNHIRNSGKRASEP